MHNVDVDGLQAKLDCSEPAIRNAPSRVAKMQIDKQMHVFLLKSIGSTKHNKATVIENSLKGTAFFSWEDYWTTLKPVKDKAQWFAIAAALKLDTEAIDMCCDVAVLARLLVLPRILHRRSASLLMVLESEPSS